MIPEIAMNKIFPAILLLIVCISAQASDLARETRLKDQIIDAILDGEPHMLKASGHEFLGIYTEADEPRGAVLILHGRGYHPDWQDVVNPLRVGLAEQGWNTLSIQLPVLEKDAKYYDYVPIFDEAVPRIDAAVEFLRQQGNDRIVLIAHSCGAHMALDWIRARKDSSIDAFVGLGMGATDYRQPMHQPFPLDWMRVPILDLYGANDYPAVIRLAPSRSEMIAKAGNPGSRQAVLLDADHYFTDQGEPLVAAVADWLDQLE